jgi:shikimate kinase
LTEETLSRVLLVGFMGAGKSTVGRRVAKELGWRFVDFDEEIERDLGCSIAEMFSQGDEQGFRAAEARIGACLMEASEVVLASGGGWPAQASRLVGLSSETVTIWLQVSAEEAVRRSSGQPGQRPLLEVGDPVNSARKLLGERSPYYSDATWRVDTEGSTVEDVTARILKILANHHHKISAE